MSYTDYIEYYEERAAIREYDGLQTREDAERGAREDWERLTKEDEG